MKKLFVLLTAALAFAAVSCTEDNPSDNNGKDDGKEKAKELTTLDSKTSTWNTDKRVFDLAFSGEGVTLSTTLIGFDAELPTGKYNLVAEARAVAGDGVLEKTLLDSKAVSSGSVTVAKSGKKYTFKFALTVDGKEESLTWSGDIEWPADPAPKQTLSVLLSAQANQVTVDNVPVEGQFTLTMNLAGAGISSSLNEYWQTVWAGEGGYLALDLFSTDKYLHEGIYKANAQGGVWGEGQFGIGYDTVIEYIGWDGQPATYEAKDWGTVWWTVSGGAAVADHKITDGIVVVRKVDAGWQITWGKEYPSEIVFEGEIAALTEPEGGDNTDGANLSITSGLTYTMVDETATNTAADGSALSGVTLWRVSVSQGSDKVAAFDLVVAAGQEDLAGTYEVMSYPDAAGKAGNGVYVPGYLECGCYYIIDGKGYLINAGSTVVVSANADGSLKFEFGPAEVGDASTWQSAGQGSLLLDNVTKA